MSRIVRIVVGMAIWIAAVGAGWWALAGRGERSPIAPRLTRQLWDYAAGRRRVVGVRFSQRVDLRPGDPVFVIKGPEAIRQVGEVASVSATPSGLTGRIVLYSCAPPITGDAHLSYHQTPYSIGWVLRTMLSEKNRRQIMAELAAALDAHREELVVLLRPVVQDALRDALRVIEQDLPAVLQRRHEELERLGNKYQREILEKELLPLVRDEIWPIVRRHAEPVAAEVGREIWQRASLWRFGWRYAYDMSPLPEKRLTEKEWSRFLREEIVPVLEAHTDQFIELQQRIVADTARNPKVREVVRRSLARIASDPEARRILREVVDEVIIDNPRLRAVFDRHWHSPRVRQAVQWASARLEPTAIRIGEVLLGTPAEGITPEFARVLRTQILGKDRRWLVLETAPAPGTPPSDGFSGMLRGSFGAPDALNPFVRETDPILSRRGRYGQQLP